MYKKKLDEVLCENSTYNRDHLKKRLFDEHLKDRNCEICGQSEEWNGNQLTLILNNVNGNLLDNRIENLKIVCPNCNDCLEPIVTIKERSYCNCGKEKKSSSIDCLSCSDPTIDTSIIYCSCGNLKNKQASQCIECYNFNKRKVSDRPDLDDLLGDVHEMGYSATGRKFGVSDNTIRKWIKNYEKTN